MSAIQNLSTEAERIARYTQDARYAKMCAQLAEHDGDAASAYTFWGIAEENFRASGYTIAADAAQLQRQIAFNKGRKDDNDQNREGTPPKAGDS